MSLRGWAFLIIFSATAVVARDAAFAETIRIATYNLQNYLDTPVPKRPLKSPESKLKIREALVALKADVLAVQEMGMATALRELQGSLKKEGLDYPHTEQIFGYDTNVHIAILSRLPFKARWPHTRDSFLSNGRRFNVSRGFGEVEIQVNANYTFTLIAAHLKSKRQVGAGDEAELRVEEAKLLRGLVDDRLRANPNLNIVVLGDFNDTHDSPAIKLLIGKGKSKLLDTRPSESAPLSAQGAETPRVNNVTWTHFYGVEDTYSRIDYILLSPGMAREWLPEESYVMAFPGWIEASDHRPVVISVTATDK